MRVFFVLLLLLSISAWVQAEALMENGLKDGEKTEGADSARGELIHTLIPASYTGTGLPEWIHYQIPDAYDPGGPGCPLLVCWHAFYQSCKSVAEASQIDESCNERGWIYLSITGATKIQLSSLLAQTHCEKAIQYMEEVLALNIDPDRIYMAGLSGGGLAAASYTARHLNPERHRVAGVIMVAAAHDLIDLYNRDPDMPYWLEQVLGGSPADLPFEYKQIGTLFLQNNSYVVNESMGINLAHHLPVFVAYAENDPNLIIPEQNAIFIEMLNDMQASYFLDYYVNAPDPHSWNLLDVEAALDYIGAYTLNDEETKSIHIVADRDEKFYWAEVIQEMARAFSELKGHVDAVQNRLDVEEATDTEVLTVDMAITGLTEEKPLGIRFQSSSPEQQTLKLAPVSIAPTFVVDPQGTLFKDWFFDPQGLTLTRQPFESLDLYISYELYSLSLTLDPQTVKIGETCDLDLKEGDPGDACLLIFAVEQTLTHVGPLHHMLVNPLPPAIWFCTDLDSSGSLPLAIRLPHDPGLAGITLYLQGATYGTGGAKEISNLAIAEIVE
ncbi:MAG: hypothetical protein ABIK28_07415 [Planctomycetota bacterium]